MIHVLVFIRKIDSITTEDFKRYYEEHHVPLINALLPFYARYFRHYLSKPLYPADASSSFDVITELVFQNQTDFDAWSATLARTDVIERIRADERNFLQSSSTQMWAVDSRG